MIERQSKNKKTVQNRFFSHQDLPFTFHYLSQNHSHNREKQDSEVKNVQKIKWISSNKNHDFVVLDQV